MAVLGEETTLECQVIVFVCVLYWYFYRVSQKKVCNKISSPAALSAAPCVSIMLKEEGLQHKMYKTKLGHCSDLVPNLVVEIEIFHFCLFVCLLVCLFTCLFVCLPIMIPKSDLKSGL